MIFYFEGNIVWAKVAISCYMLCYVGIFQIVRMDGKIAAMDARWKAHAKAEVASKVRCNKWHRETERLRKRCTFSTSTFNR